MFLVIFGCSTLLNTILEWMKITSYAEFLGLDYVREKNFSFYCNDSGV